MITRPDDPKYDNDWQLGGMWGIPMSVFIFFGLIILVLAISYFSGQSYAPYTPEY